MTFVELVKVYLSKDRAPERSGIPNPKGVYGGGKGGPGDW